MLKTTDTQLLGRLLELDGKKLSPVKARLVLSLNFADSDVERVMELGDKCNEGTLTSQEREEYEAYVRVGTILDTLKSRARLALKKLGKSA